MADCKAKTRDGSPCQIAVPDGESYCHVHRRQKRWKSLLSVSAVGGILLGVLGFVANVLGIFDYAGIRPAASETPTVDPMATANYLATTLPSRYLTPAIDTSGRSHPAGMRLVPDRQAVPLNSEFTLNVVVDSNGVQVIGVDAVLKYDPAMLGVVGITDDAFGPGVYPYIDSEKGEISISAISSKRCQEPGSYAVANITFRALQVGEANVDFIFSVDGSGDSNVIDCYDMNAFDALGTVLSGTYQIVDAE
jgi:hypothetical protein